MYVKKNNWLAAPAAPPTRSSGYGQQGTRDRDEGRALSKPLQSYVTKTGTMYPWLRDPRKPELEPITDKLPRLVERPAPDAPKLNPSIAAYLGGIDPSTVPNYCAAEVPMLMRSAIGKRAIERNAFDPNRDYSKHGPPVAKLQQYPVPATIEPQPRPWSPSYTDVLLNRCYDPAKAVNASSGGFNMKKAPTKGNTGPWKKNEENRIKVPAQMNDSFPALETESKRSKDKPMSLIEKKKKQWADEQKRVQAKGAPGESLPIPSSKTMKMERKTYSLGPNIPIDPELVAIRQKKMKEAERLKAERLKKIEEKAAMDKAKKERIEQEIKIERARLQELMEIEKERKRAKQRERKYKESQRAQIEETKLRKNEEKTKLAEQQWQKILNLNEENKSINRKNRASRERYEQEVSFKHGGSKSSKEFPRTEKRPIEIEIQMEEKMSPKVEQVKQGPESYHRRQSVEEPRQTTGAWEQKAYFGDPMAIQSTQKSARRPMELDSSLPVNFAYTGFRSERNDLPTASDGEIDEDERQAYEAKIRELHEALKLQSLRSARKEKPDEFDTEDEKNYEPQKTIMAKQDDGQRGGGDWDWAEYQRMTARPTKITMLAEYGEGDYEKEIDNQTFAVKARKTRSRRRREGESSNQVMETATTSIENPIAVTYSNDEQESLNEKRECEGFGSSIQNSKTNQDMSQSTMKENGAVDGNPKAATVKRIKSAEAKKVAEEEAPAHKELGWDYAENQDHDLLAQQKRKDRRNRNDTTTKARKSSTRHSPANETKCAQPILENDVEPRPARYIEEDKPLEFASPSIEEKQKKIPEEDTGLSEDFQAFMKKNGMIINTVTYPEPGEDFGDFLKRKERIQLEREQEQKLAQKKVGSAKASKPPKKSKPEVFKAPEGLGLTVYGKKISITDDLPDDQDFLNLGVDEEYIEEDDESHLANLAKENEPETNNIIGGNLPETTEDSSSFLPEMPDFETFMEKNNMIIDEIVYPEFGEDPEDFKKRKEMTILRNRQIKQEENRKKFATRCDESPDENFDCQRNLVEFFSNRPSTSMEAGDSLHGISNLSYEISDDCAEMADIPGLVLKKNSDDMEAEATTEPEHRELFWEEDITADRLEAEFKWLKMKQDVGLRYQSPAFR